METVSFYSYKGGVGRTLLVANTAQFLALSGRRVVVLDLDLEAPGLHQKLCIGCARERSKRHHLRGAVDALLATLSAKPTSFQLSDLAVEVDLSTGSKGVLVLIPAGSAPSHSYWQSLDNLHMVLRSERHGSLAEAVLELQARIADELAPDFLLVDSRTGITELGGLATSLLADRVVCLSTTAPESIEGTCVVADALRRAPRLPSQKPLQLEFLVTRFVGSFNRSEYVAQLEKKFGDSVAVLPHDQGIADEERVLSGWRPAEFNSHYGTSDAAGTSLFTSTLSWIAEAFPGHKEEAELARRRMEAVHRAWRHLTTTTERVGRGVGSRSAWPIDQLGERVRYGKGVESRQADIVIYADSVGTGSAGPLMIIEYVGAEDRDAVAKWWFRETQARVVVILFEQSDRRIYSRRIEWDSEVRHSERWDIPMPHDFTALSDPTDVSLESLLDAVRRGHPEYLDRIVSEWVRSSAAGLHGGAPWRPKRAKRIMDGLADIEDPELASRVLWRIAFARERGSSMWLGDGDEFLQEQVITELFTPLFWRLPAEAAIQLLEQRGRPFGPPPGRAALSLLARELLGLHYDPDYTFRKEGQQFLEHSSRLIQEKDERYDRALYDLAPDFRGLEIKFEFSEDDPPVVKQARDEESEGVDGTKLSELLAERISRRALIITGLLGYYEADSATVTLYRNAIAQCAEKLALRPRYVAGITLIYEVIHALSHVARDLDGRMWEDFALPPPKLARFERSSLHETAAHYFTFQHLSRLGDTALLHAFETLSERQVHSYRTWHRRRHVPLEDFRTWFLSIRRGVGPGLVTAQWLGGSASGHEN